MVSNHEIWHSKFVYRDFCIPQRSLMTKQKVVLVVGSVQTIFAVICTSPKIHAVFLCVWAMSCGSHHSCPVSGLHAGGGVSSKAPVCEPHQAWPWLDPYSYLIAGASNWRGRELHVHNFHTQIFTQSSIWCGNHHFLVNHMMTNYADRVTKSCVCLGLWKQCVVVERPC